MNRIKHVYFSNPANILINTTINDFAVSDVLISDTSSILYEYLITLKPIIIAESNYLDLHDMPDNMNINNIARKFNNYNSDIIKLVYDTIDCKNTKNHYKAMLNNCFYFNDGHSTKRAIEFLSSL